MRERIRARARQPVPDGGRADRIIPERDFLSFEERVFLFFRRAERSRDLANFHFRAIYRPTSLNSSSSDSWRANLTPAPAPTRKITDWIP